MMALSVGTATACRSLFRYLTTMRMTAISLAWRSGAGVIKMCAEQMSARQCVHHCQNNRQIPDKTPIAFHKAKYIKFCSVCQEHRHSHAPARSRTASRERIRLTGQDRWYSETNREMVGSRLAERLRAVLRTVWVHSLPCVHPLPCVATARKSATADASRSANGCLPPQQYACFSRENSRILSKIAHKKSRKRSETSGLYGLAT